MYSVLSDAVIDTITKNKLWRKEFGGLLDYRPSLGNFRAGSQAENLEQGLWRNAVYLLAQLPNSQAHLSKDGTTQSDLSLHTSVCN